MKITKSQKVYFGLLVVGLVALGVDRLTSPAAAQAADESASLLVKPADSSAGVSQMHAPAVTSGSLLVNPISQKLVQLSESTQTTKGVVNDAFTPATAWSGAPTGAMAASGGVSFPQAHHLSGVLVAGRAGQAMVDGKSVAIGQVLDGFKLIAVKSGMAIFQAGDVSVTLHIDKAQ